MTDLILLNYSLDVNLMLIESTLAKHQARPYTDTRYAGLDLNEIFIHRHTSPAIEKIIDDFEVDGSPRFYWMAPHAVFPEHVDNNTQCSINFVLSNNPAPVTFGSNQYLYRQALLNTTRPHAVYNGDTARILLKISIFNETFESLAARIKYKA